MDPPQDAALNQYSVIRYVTELDLSRGGLEYNGKIADVYELRKIVEKLLSELWENGRLAQASIDKIIAAGRPTTWVNK